MTGAYAHEWPGSGPWRQHGCGRPNDLEALFGWLMTLAAGKGGGRTGHRRPTPEELDDLIVLRRMRGMGGPLFGPRGPRGRGRGRARRGDVRLAVLRLLAEEPRNGYQLMQAIEERSNGSWRPSPGSMYPTLSQLEDEGLIRSVQSEGGPKSFEITDAGREHLNTRAGEPDPWKSSEEPSDHAMAELGPLVIGIGKAVWQVASVGTEEQRARAMELLAETRRGLYAILAEDPEGDDTAADDPAPDDDPGPGVHPAGDQEPDEG